MAIAILNSGCMKGKHGAGKSSGIAQQKIGPFQDVQLMIVKGR
jgi:hypothetical protein